MEPQPRSGRGGEVKSNLDRHGTIVLDGPAVWLENRREDPVWLLKDLDSPRRVKGRALRFDYILPDRSRLTDPQNAHLYQVAKTYAVLIREGPFAIADALRAKTHVNLVRNLLSIIGWMRLNNVPAFEALSRSDVEQLTADASCGIGVQLRCFERIQETLIRLVTDADGREPIGLIEVE